MRGSITVGFLPWWPGNPYQLLLKRELNQLNVRVIGNPPLSFLKLLLGRDGLDVIHVHWPHGTYKTTLQFIYILFLLIAYRLLRNNVVWTVHEMAAYESLHPRRDSWFRSVVMKLSRRLIVHGRTTQEALVQNHGYRRPITVARHPSYSGWYKDETTREQARAKLEAPDDSLIFLYFGYIKPYKGVEDLIEAFTKVSNPKALLYIVGKPLDEAIRRQIEEAASTDSRIHLNLAYVADDEIQYFFRAADVAVFPFHHTETSGSLMLALTFGCPVIAPNIPSLCEYVDPSVGFLFDVSSTESLQEVLNGVRKDSLSEKAEGARQRAKRDGWRHMAELHILAYKDM